jgi:uncharacterized membrane protein (UPF0127 family)
MKLLIPAALILVLTGACISSTAAYGYEYGSVKIFGKKTYKAGVIVADTIKEQELGLMFIRRLAPDKGLLMVLPRRSAEPAIWMKNMFIPLDVIFINGGKVVQLYKNIPPCRTKVCKIYFADETINRILEVKSGVISRYGIKAGDKIKIRITKNTVN